MRKYDFTECDIYAARIAALRPLPKETLKSLREYYRIGLTYTSNALEGNSLTESETKVVVEEFVPSVTECDVVATNETCIFQEVV